MMLNRPINDMPCQSITVMLTWKPTNHIEPNFIFVLTLSANPWVTKLNGTELN